MKKFTLILSICLFYLISANAQVFTSSLEGWAGNVPNNWVGVKTSLEADSISQYTTNVHGGTSAVKLVNVESTHKRFTTQPVTVTNGTVYTITFWVRGHGNVRTGLFDGRATGSGYATYNAYISINSNTWTQQTQTIAAENDTVAAEFIFSVQLTNGDIDHLQIDDVNISGGGALTPAIDITSPANNATLYSGDVNVNCTVTNFVVGNPGAGIDGHIHYTVDGGAAVMKYDVTPIALTGLAAGSHKVIMELVDNSHNPLSPAIKDSVSFTVSATPPATISIHDIQYTTDISGNSPYMDQVVTTRGVITAKYASGYFIQDGNGAWNGLYVYDNVNLAAQGDSVLLTGTIVEYYNLTELKTLTAFSIVNSGNTLPTPEVVTATTHKTEQFEGVLVKIMNATCTDDNSGFGMWRVNDGTDTTKIHNLLYAYTPVLNHIYNITGPSYYTFNEFRIEPRNISDVEDVTGIEEAGMNNVAIYPNPVRDFVTVETLENISGVNVYSVDGRLVISQSVSTGNNVGINTSELLSGVYFIHAISSEGTITTGKFIK